MTEESSKSLDERIDQVEEQLYWLEIDHRAERRQAHDVRATSQFFWDSMNRSEADHLAERQMDWEESGGRDDQGDYCSLNWAPALN
jgi:hypothetical protein